MFPQVLHQSLQQGIEPVFLAQAFLHQGQRFEHDLAGERDPAQAQVGQCP
jgi:hypothetical protein